MKRQNHYMTLGLPKGASPDEIRKAYRALALRYHPDRNPDDQEASTNFQAIVEAYQVLSDPEQRKQYDRFGALVRSDGRPPQKEDLSAFFSDKFSGIFQNANNRRGESIHTNINISLEDVARGTEKSLQIRCEIHCGLCVGSGAAKDGKQICTECAGKGRSGSLLFKKQCIRCGGRGYLITKRCRKCGGTGRIDRSETIDIKLPVGVVAGQRLRIKGRGHAGYGNGAPGDLYLLIQITEHEIFQRRGNDLFCDIPILWSEAILGTELCVPTLEGTSLIRIPKGTASHQVFRLSNRGIPSKEGKTYGDIHYRVIVEVPTLSSQQEPIIQSLQQQLPPSSHPKLQAFRKNLQEREQS
ncbi:MAG: DnaJ C-terminal domain-containing protein [Myxococcota bacterium]|nr:DnaJ C-terminal domain-containing protein [Myxococcota bacterium]